ncbi:CMRF35-like molecule 9 isoform X2 [Brienomyrus brachyistius]|uniref:CMRF35-like molecule 9 isoform X2 n=1 Tax=Brienomyrus brachyistius TaxID=42636 RepID=UPI0020B2C4B4|nr:CMRF35-like molecule 9 isoform X2 [Brienomyrus brachyistius]
MRNLIVAICLLSAGCWVVSGVVRVSGYEGQRVTIRCSHGNAGSNSKYFCLGHCSSKDILVKTVEGHIYQQKGRFSLYDNRSGTFTVTITGLRKTDTGRYWCGVERTGADTYTEVHLRVTEASSRASSAPQLPSRVPATSAHPQDGADPPGTSGPLPQHSSGVPRQFQGHSTTETMMAVQNAVKFTHYVTFITAAVSSTALLFALSVLIIYKQRKGVSKNSPATFTSTVNTEYGVSRNSIRAEQNNGMSVNEPDADTFLTSDLSSLENNHIYSNIQCNPLQTDSIYLNINPLNPLFTH